MRCNNGIMCTGHNQVQITRVITKIQNNGDKRRGRERHLNLWTEAENCHFTRGFIRYGMSSVSWFVKSHIFIPLIYYQFECLVP